MPNAILTNPTTLRRFLEAAETERVLHLVLMDSRSFWGLDGSNHGGGMYKGLGQALGARYGVYATPRLPGNLPVNGYNHGSATSSVPPTPAALSPDKGLVVGGNFVRYSETDILTNTGAPAELHRYGFPWPGGVPNAQNGKPSGYLYASGFAGAANNRGLWLWPKTPQPDGGRGLLELDHQLRYHVTYGTFTSGSGDFRLCVKSHEGHSTNGQGTVYAYGPAVPSNAGAFGLVDTYLEVPAGPRDPYGVWFKPFSTTGSSGGVIDHMNSPAFVLSQQVEDTEIAAGVCVSLVGHFGGQTSRDAAAYYLDADGDAAAGGYDPHAAFEEYLREELHVLGGPPADAKIVIWIGFDVNDIDGPATPSLGPSPSPSNTREGFADNHLALIDWWRARLAAAGVSQRSVLFVLTAPHAAPGDLSTRRAWREHLADVFAVDGNVSVVDGNQVMNADQLLAAGMVYEPLPAHLDGAAAYWRFSESLIAAALSADEAPPSASEIAAAVDAVLQRGAANPASSPAAALDQAPFEVRSTGSTC